MRQAGLMPAVAADAPAVSELVVALERSLYGRSTFSLTDLQDEWSQLDLERDVRVVRDGASVVGYGAVRLRGDVWRVEGYVHPAALGRGIGRLLAITLEQEAAAGGARAVQNAVFEADAAAGALLGSLGYRAVRTFREMRIELDGPPAARLRRVVELPPGRRALRPGAVVRRPRQQPDRRGSDRHRRHVRRRLDPRALHSPAVAPPWRRRRAAG